MNNAFAVALCGLRRYAIAIGLSLPLPCCLQ